MEAADNDDHRHSDSNREQHTAEGNKGREQQQQREVADKDNRE